MSLGNQSGGIWLFGNQEIILVKVKSMGATHFNLKPLGWPAISQTMSSMIVAKMITSPPTSSGSDFSRNTSL